MECACIKVTEVDAGLDGNTGVAGCIPRRTVEPGWTLAGVKRPNKASTDIEDPEEDKRVTGAAGNRVFYLGVGP